jgi:hypothetical protein
VGRGFVSAPCKAHVSLSLEDISAMEAGTDKAIAPGDHHLNLLGLGRR